MKRLSRTLAMVALAAGFSQPALASFQSVTCSSADGKVYFERSSTWDNKNKHFWRIDDQEYAPEQVKETSLKRPISLEQPKAKTHLRQRFLGKKVRIEYTSEKVPQQREVWLICRDAAGI